MILYIRTEANRTTAMGHMMRCLAIADAAADKGIASVFIVAEKGSEKFPRERGYETICTDRQWDDFTGEIPVMQKLIIERQIGILLIDSYFVTKEYMDAVTRMTKTAYIDDLHAQIWSCSLLINYAVYHDLYDYRQEYLKTRLLLGCEYVPLRREFRDLPNKKLLRKETEKTDKNVGPSELFHILVVTGGTDEYHFMKRFLEVLLKKEALFKGVVFTLVCGAYNQELDIIRELASKYHREKNAYSAGEAGTSDGSGAAGEDDKKNMEINIVSALPTLKDKMMEADILITAGGTTLYEMAACGTPGICFSIADNQLDNVKGFADRDLAWYAGDVRKDFSYEKLLKLVEELMRDDGQREAVSERLRKLVDGNGASRIAEALIMTAQI